MKLFKTHDEILHRVNELTKDLRQWLRGEEEVVVLAILDGATFFATDLCLRLNLNPCYCAYWKLSSYGNEQKSSGIIREEMPYTVSVTNRQVVLVDDIADTGNTLKFAHERLRQDNPKGITTVTLLKRKTCPVNIDFYGFEVTDGFFVGYGLDDQQNARNLPGLFTL